MLEKKAVESKKTKYIFSFSPMILFALLLPFMLGKVPHHTDLLGNVDGLGSRLFMCVAMSIFSGLLYYMYSNISKKRLFFSLMLSAIMCLITLFLLASVVEMENIFKGFSSYISDSYGNQMSFIVFATMMLLFITVDIIPPNSIFGLRNSVTMKSQEAWYSVHTKSKPIVLYCSLANLYIFLIPNVDNLMKMLLGFATIILAIVAITVISHKFKSEIGK